MENTTQAPETVETTDNSTAETTTADTTESTTQEQLAIDNKALKELLAESKATMDALKNELAEVKKTNAKLVAKMDVSTPEVSIDDLINDTFINRK